MNRFKPVMSRRRLLAGTAAAVGSASVPALLKPALAAGQSAAVVASDKTRPALTHGLQFGDPRLNEAGRYGLAQSADVIAWARTDKLSRLDVEWSLHENFSTSLRLPSLLLHPADDHTGRVDLTGLPAGERIFVRMVARDLDSGRAASEPVLGQFVTPAAAAADIRFVWGGDTVGQGWGISPNQGGMKTYSTMLARKPDFFVHSGDTIYADGPLSSSQKMPDGNQWENLLIEEVTKVAETLNEFRANYRYNMMDEHVRRFNAEVPQIWQWDDHEVVNNWSGSKDLSDDDRYTEKRVPVLVARASRAFLEYAPMRNAGDQERDRVYRKTPYGPALDLFSIDMRSYRAANGANLQTEYDASAHMLGPVQLQWIKDSLLASKATWKVICADMPIGLQVGRAGSADRSASWEAVANGDPNGPRGREQEFASLLGFIKANDIQNVVWITADVHYCAAHHYSPERAAFKDFTPFWEFVAGPLHAGAFGPAKLDATFGPEEVFVKAPPAQNMPPVDENQFFGQIDIDGKTGVMTVALVDRGGATIFSRAIDPV